MQGVRYTLDFLITNIDRMGSAGTVRCIVLKGPRYVASFIRRTACMPVRTCACCVHRHLHLPPLPLPVPLPPVNCSSTPAINAIISIPVCQPAAAV
ncbi:hypothetical protein EON67_04385 [archaeon]|nr:MAG: hypothetical protein EON67_04385 [archaeon]